MMHKMLKRSFLLLSVLPYAICQWGYGNEMAINVGDPFDVWCNLSSSWDLSAGFEIRWKKNDNPWCTMVIGLSNSTTEQCATRGVNVNDVYNPSGTQHFQLNIAKSVLSDSGNYSCAFYIPGNLPEIPTNHTTFLFVVDMQTTSSEPTLTSTLVKEHSEDPASAGLSKEIIIAIGASGGGGVLLIIIIIVAVVCVKKNSKGNSTTDIVQEKATNREGNPLDKNVENIHYADLTLHDNPKSPSSKGTESAKSKTLTVNPSDDRVEYAAVMAS